jgi:hypothetical protein
MAYFNRWNDPLSHMLVPRENTTEFVKQKDATMPAFTFEKLPPPARRESVGTEHAKPNVDARSSLNRMLDRFTVLRLRRSAALISRSQAKKN